MGADFYFNPPTRPPSLREAIADQPHAVILLLLQRCGLPALQRMIEQVHKEYAADPLLACAMFSVKDIENF